MTATQRLLAVAQSTQDVDTAKRATYLAKFSQNPDLLQQTSLLWSQLSPQDPRPWQYMAQSASLMGEFNKATLALEQELKLGGGEGLPYIASLYINNTVATQVNLQNTLQSWLDTYPNHKQLLLALALLAQHSKQLDTAIIYTSKALAQDTHYLQAQVVYGELLLASQQTEAADTYLSQFTQPLKKAPRHLITLHAQVLTLLAKYEQAYESFNELATRYPEDPSYSYSAGLLAYENHQYAQVYQHLQHLIELDSDNHSAYYYMGLSALHEDLPTQAVDYLQQVSKGPDRLNALTLLLDLDSPEAQKRTPYFDQLRQQNQDLAADIFALEAQYLQNMGDTDSAIGSYQAALQLYPDHIHLLYNYTMS